MRSLAVAVDRVHRSRADNWHGRDLPQDNSGEVQCCWVAEVEDRLACLTELRPGSKPAEAFF